MEGIPHVIESLYSGSGFSDWEIGDITVIIHRGEYHLFHLIIPNHDYIAHAISKDGINWKRVKNSIFVGDPGSWDDDMLWTMHVCRVGEQFEMYYTGLHLQDRGAVSKIGLAVSPDLMNWEKVENNIFPIGSEYPYETVHSNPRKWLSFRDPFRFEHNGQVYFLVCGRVSEGPVSRRGCSGLIRVEEDKVVYLSPLHHPMAYDDIECPCVFELSNRFYLIGSIREDVKVRYWFAPEFLGEYHCFHNNVLLPQGNYAARTVNDNGRLLVFNFFYAKGNINAMRLLPPPKQLETDKKGRLLLKSYYRWNEMVSRTIVQEDIKVLTRLFKNPTAHINIGTNKWICGSRSGFELFCFERPSVNFIFEGIMTVEGMGKLGLISDADEEGSGYYFSFDTISGLVQIRAWGFNPADNKSNFIFKTLQDNLFPVDPSFSFHFRLIRYGHYIELSINDVVRLTLIDYEYSGRYIGIYSASSTVSLQDMQLKILPDMHGEYASQEGNENLKKD